MKKFLLLAAALLGMASGASAVTLRLGTQVTNATVGTAITDGAVVALQCLDTNGGGNYFFNGAAAKTAELTYDNLYKIVAQGTEGNFVMQRLKDNTYVGSNGTPDSHHLVADVENLSDAVVFKSATVVEATGWSTIVYGVVNGTNTIRFTATNDNFLNTNERTAAAKWFTGTGGYSVWYVYTFSKEEIDGINNPINVTLNFKDPGGADASISRVAAGNLNIESQLTDVMPWYVATGVAEENKTVSETNNTFTLQGSWNLPFNFGQVYRMNLRKGAEHGCTYFYYDSSDNKAKTRNGNDAGALIAERLWYINYAGISNGEVKGTLHTLALDGKGLKVDNANNAQGTMESDPCAFAIVTSTQGTNGVALRHPDSDRAHVNDINGTLGLWNDAGSRTDGGSFFSFFSLTDDDYAALALANTDAAIAAAKANPTAAAIKALLDNYTGNELLAAIAAVQNYPIGKALGQFNNEDGNFTEVIANARELAKNPEATEEQISAAVAALAASNLSINQPAPGFYRFGLNGSYMTSTVNENNRLVIENQSDPDRLNNTTVFYYDGTRLITFPEGKVIASFPSSGANAEGAWATVLSTSNLAGNVTFSASTVALGKYNIAVNNSPARYIYHRTDIVDAGGGTNNDAGYQWDIIPVSWLPIPCAENDAYLSVYAPVELIVGEGYGAGRVAHHYGAIQGDKFGKLAFEGITIPAATPALLEKKAGYLNGCIYLEIAAANVGGVATQADVTSDLKGATNFLATAKEEGKSYFTVNNNAFTAHEGDYVPGFVAHLAVPTASAKNSYEIAAYDNDYTGISEIGAAQAGKQVIYDLQGRRVQRAAKGLYIINGVKTLVK